MKRTVFRWACAFTLSALPVPTAIVWAASSASSHSAVTTAADTGQRIPAPSISSYHQALLIQGSVVDVRGDWITVHTPDIRPTCSVGRPCPQFIIAGTTFKVYTKHAMYESANGQVTTPLLMVGEPLVVYGTTPHVGDMVSPTPSNVHEMDASVIERIVIPSNSSDKNGKPVM